MRKQKPETGAEWRNSNRLGFGIPQPNRSADYIRERQGKKQGLIFIISGPSGSGKTTLIRALIEDKDLKQKCVKSISFTTRPKRSGEKEARDYFFITPAQLRQKQKAKKVLERTRYLGYYYATPKDFVERQLKKGKCLVMCLDLKGAFAIKRLYPKNVATIFIMSSSLETLRQRIKQRCNKTGKAEVQRRLALAKRELLAATGYDYCLINENLRQAVKGLKRIILNNINALT